eukprot:1789954-Pyramimonas_sp.AAC.1
MAGKSAPFSTGPGKTRRQPSDLKEWGLPSERPRKELIWGWTGQARHARDGLCIAHGRGKGSERFAAITKKLKKATTRRRVIEQRPMAQ